MELTLEEIKCTELDILRFFKQFCAEHGLRFFLSNGTLLGAVKYGGFIPWDDDIDVFVPREDYDRLIEVYQDGERYRLFSPEREPNYRYPFAKLCDMTTMKEESNIDNGVRLGVDIDIFPLDTCTAHMLSPKVQRKMQRYQVGCILSKLKTSKGRPIHKRCIIEYIRMRGYGHFHKKLGELVRAEGALGATHKGCLMWPIYGEREILPAEVFAETIDLTFEGELFPAPAGYDAYLRSLYGEYEKDPPLEKQKTHHSFKAYRREAYMSEES